MQQKMGKKVSQVRFTLKTGIMIAWQSASRNLHRPNHIA